eukprot:scaffold31036_cov160-Skeletonema_menzelii.AAC.3
MEFNLVAVRVLSRGDIVVAVSRGGARSSDFLFLRVRIPHPERPLPIEMGSMPPRIKPDLFFTHTG